MTGLQRISQSRNQRRSRSAESRSGSELTSATNTPPAAVAFVCDEGDEGMAAAGGVTDHDSGACRGQGGGARRRRGV
jgi:hypothetical protein